MWAALLVGLCVPRAARAQIGGGPEAAPPLVYNAEIDLEKAHSQNWALAQDPQGVVYVGNGDGLISFDGARWDYGVVPLDSAGAREKTLRALARGPSGRLYIGLVDAFGYVDPARSNAFVSLSSALPESARGFGAVWSAAALLGAAYFVSDTHVFRVPLPYARTPDPRTVQAFSTADIRDAEGEPVEVPDGATPFLGFAANGRFYVHFRRIGLCVASFEGLQLVPGGETLAQTGVFGIVPLGRRAEDGLLVVASNGLYRYDGRAFTPVTGPAAERVVAAEPYTAALGPNRTVAIGTRREGVLFLGRDGSLVAQVGAEQGLRSGNVTGLLVDREGDTWVALDDGVGRIETDAAVGAFDEASGLRGGPQTFARVRSPADSVGAVYAGTGLGLYRLRRAAEPGSFARFEPVDAVATTVWSLLPPVDGDGPLLVGTTNGLYAVDPDRPEDAQQVWYEPSEAIFSLLRDPSDPTLLWAGGSSALFGLRLQDGAYTVAYRHDTGDSVRSFFADGRGRLWAGTGATGLLRLDRPDADLRRYDARHGLGQDYERLFLAHAGGRPLAMLHDSVLVYDEGGDRFVRDAKWYGDFSAASIVEDGTGAVWVLGGATQDDQFLLRYPRQGAAPDTMLTRIGSAILDMAYPEPDGTVWLTGLNALYRTRPPQRPLPPLAALVRRASTLGTDSTLFDGFGLPSADIPLNFADRALRFTFGATSFDEPSTTKYQVRLEGLDGAWSRWTDEAQRDYTNIPAGDYTFGVRARDVHGRISPPATFSFTVLPPWYQTTWASALWAFLGLGCVAAFVRWQNVRRDERERELERQVRARTREVEQQAQELTRLNEALAKQAAELRRSNEELWEAGELKAHLLGMAAHDLQTPLTSVLGFSDVLIDEIPPGDERRAIARRIRDASDEMRVLIRDLLDSVAAQTGRLQLTREYVDLCEVAAEAVRRLEPHANRKGQSLLLLTDGPARSDVDADRVRDAMTNLLSNAVKYAPHESAINVLAALEGDLFRFSVRDRGPGLSRAEQSRLFRPFERLSPQPTGGEASSGLGLFLVQEIAQLHGGRVEVQSQAGQGSTFTLFLPADPPEDEAPEGDGSARGRAVPAEREQQQ